MRCAAIVSVLAIAFACTVAPEVQAQERKAKANAAKVEAQQPAGFSTLERQIIVEFFRDYSYKATSLPPGIAKNLARGKPLPPGIAKQHIPAELKARLPVRAGVEISIFGDRIVLLEASGLVVDILAGILD